jgi:serine/threonine-protein kinase
MASVRRERHGETIGRYRLIDQLGSGGMATVHRAQIEGAKGFTRTVVLKRILPELAEDRHFVDMMVAEARLCSLINHPAIVQVQDFGEVDGELFLVMEYIDGFDLASVLRRCMKLERRMPPGLVCYVVSEVAAALAYAHALRDESGEALGLVHRDVSPSNIMLTAVGTVKLLDFGIAKALHGVSNEKTLTGTLKGKMGYLSPEQADAQPIDLRSDLFSLGVVLWECLTSQRLFKGSSDLESLRLVRELKVARPSSLIDDLDPEIDDVVGQMLAPTPETRISSGDEVRARLAPIAHRAHADASALQAFVAELEPIRPTNWRAPTIAGYTASEGDSAVEGRGPTRDRSANRRSLVPWLAATSLLLGLGAAIYWKQTGHTSPSIPSPSSRASAPPAASTPPQALRDPPAVIPPAVIPPAAPDPADSTPTARRSSSAKGKRARAPSKAPTPRGGVVLKDPFAR